MGRGPEVSCECEVVLHRPLKYDRVEITRRLAAVNVSLGRGSNLRDAELGQEFFQTLQLARYPVSAVV